MSRRLVILLLVLVPAGVGGAVYAYLSQRAAADGAVQSQDTSAGAPTTSAGKTSERAPKEADSTPGTHSQPKDQAKPEKSQPRSPKGRPGIIERYADRSTPMLA